MFALALGVRDGYHTCGHFMPGVQGRIGVCWLSLALGHVWVFMAPGLIAMYAWHDWTWLDLGRHRPDT